jgi:hypothetical protein
MERFLERNNVQLALIQAINNTNVTGKYFDMRGKRGVVAIMSVLTMAATKTAKVELLQAKDASGTDAKGIPTTAAQAATKTVTANTSVIEATAEISSIANTDVITVNGTAFTKAAAEDTDANEFDDGDSLASQINSDVSGVTASFDTNTLTVVADDGYTITISKTENAGTITLATVEAIAVVDVDAIDMDNDNGFYFVAPKVTTTANTTATSVVMVTRDHYHNKVAQPSPHVIA